MISAFREQDLRRINPDGDKLSDKSYEEIMVLLRTCDITDFNEYLHRTENQLESASHNTRKRAKINPNDLKPANHNSVSFIFGSIRQNSNKR